MIPGPFVRFRVAGLVGAASLALLATALPTSQAAPAPPGTPSVRSVGSVPAARAPRPAATPQLSAAARSRGIEAGNAPMGWRHADLSAASTLKALAGAASPTTLSASRTKLVKMSGVLGIDVSSYQRNVNWGMHTGQNRVFAYIKATEGSSYRNPYFTSQSSGALKAGVIRGAYHFANPSGAGGKTQAAYFVKNGGAWRRDGKTLPGVLDIEYNPYGGNDCYNISKAKMVAWISDFLTEYKRLTTRDAVIYTTADWWRRCTGDTTKFSQTNPLWVARYGTSTPGTLPGKWPFYTFWQYSSNPIDQNKFSAGYNRLQVLAGR